MKAPSKAATPKPQSKAQNKAQFRLRMYRGDVIAIGPGKVALLEAIGSTGSISAGARQLGMSYRRAWLLMDELNQQLVSPALSTAAGGANGGGAALTPVGEELIKRYRAIEEAARKATVRDTAALMRLICG